jgi:hypothetical protein
VKKVFRDIREKRAAARLKRRYPRHVPVGKPTSRYKKGLNRLMKMPRMMLWALFMEGVETKQMLHTFARHGKGLLYLKMEGDKPTEEEMRQAKEQLRDLPKFIPFFVFVVVPLPGVTEGYALMAVTLENWLGLKVSLLPSQFSKIFKKDQPQ